MKTLDFVLKTLLLSGVDMGGFDQFSDHRCYVILAVERDGNDPFDAYT